MNEQGPSRADTLTHVVLWTPQIVWALLAAALLVGVVVGLRRQRRLGWLAVLPYGMVLLAILAQVEIYGVSPFSPNAQYHSREVFWDSVTPSLWGLGLLAGLHAVLALSRRRQAHYPE